MKYVCLNKDACGHHEYVEIESLTKADFENPFKNCTQCKYVMVLVQNDFRFNSIDNLLFLEKLNPKSN